MTMATFELAVITTAQHAVIEASDVVRIARGRGIEMSSQRASALLRRLAREGHLEVWRTARRRTSWRSGANLAGYQVGATTFRATRTNNEEG